MNYGLYLSASGVQVNMYRQDVFANNLANSRTVGFKTDLAPVRQRDPETVENSLGLDLRQDLLDKIGGGVLAARGRIDFSPGNLEQTYGPLDAALSDPHSFFVVRQTDANGQSSIRLTRDGRFTQNDQGQIVTVAGNHAVLDADDSPIFIDGQQPVHVDDAGNLKQNGQVIATLGVATVTDPNALRKEQNNLLRIDGDDSLRQPSALRGMRSGYIETSAVDPIQSLMQVIGATKAATSNANMIRYHDTLMDRAVNTFGRVA